LAKTAFAKIAFLTILFCSTIAFSQQKSTPIKGTFISLAFGLHQGWTKEDWDAEFEAMAKLKFDTLIVQSSARFDPNLGKVVSFYQGKNFKVERPHIDWIMCQAENRGWKVFLGGFSDSTGDDANKAEFIELNKKISDEIYSKYKSFKSLSGFYISTEPLLNEAATAVNDRVYSDYGNYLKKKYPNMKVAISPYFITDATPRMKKQGLKKWWHDRTPDEMAQQTACFLKVCPADIMAVQDSTCWDVTMADLRKYIPKIAEAVTSTGCEFWVDMEVFDTTNHTKDVPASIERIKEQIDIEKNYKCIMYSFDWCMSPSGTDAMKTLYKQYSDAFFK
jgi:hypothetical protein